jgi:hypothetical protein
MNRVIDFRDDMLASYAVQGGNIGAVAPMLKEAAYIPPGQEDPRDFALIIVDDRGSEHYKFPCKTAGDTFLSLWYLENVESGLPDFAKTAAAENLTRMAGIHELDLEDIFPAAFKRAQEGQNVFRQKGGGEISKTASALTVVNDIYRLDERRVHVPVTMLHPVAAMRDMQKSASQAPQASLVEVLRSLKQAWPSMPEHERRDAALELDKQASAVGLELPEEISVYVGVDFADSAGSALIWRGERFGTEKTAEHYRRLSALIKTASITVPEAIEATYIVDEMSGITGYDDATCPDPYKILLAPPTTKKASAWSWTKGDAYITESQLKSFLMTPRARHQLEQLFEDGLVDKLRKNPTAEFDKLPTVQAMIIARMANDGTLGAERTIP